MDETTGEAISGVSDLKQRIGRLLRTRVGTLPLRRKYGSNLPDIVDRKINEAIKVDIYMEVAAALANPANGVSTEFRLQRSDIEQASSGGIVINLEGFLLIDGTQITMSGVTLK